MPKFEQGNEVSPTEVAPAEHSERGKAARKDFSIESHGQRFDFVEFESEVPTLTLLVHFPGFAADAEPYAAALHDAMDRNYETLAFSRYGETYAREALMDALEQAIQQSGKSNTVLHGGSFGTAVIYDLLSDPACREFLTRNNVIGAILETPVLDKQHLQSVASKLPEKALVKGALLMNKARSENPGQGLVALSTGEARSILQEALRAKTEGRKIETPMYVIFSENDNLADNEKIKSTLQGQAEKMGFTTVPSSDKMGHHIADDQYWPMWKKEKEIVGKLEKLRKTQNSA